MNFKNLPPAEEKRATVTAMFDRIAQGTISLID